MRGRLIGRKRGRNGEKAIFGRVILKWSSMKGIYALFQEDLIGLGSLS